MRLGSVVRKWRIASEIKGTELAKELGITTHKLASLEKGAINDADTLSRVLTWLMGEEPPAQVVAEHSLPLEPETDLKAKPATLADDPWLLRVKADPLYSWIDIDSEIRRMRIWMNKPANSGRRITRGFVLNWLNKKDPPVNLNGNGHLESDNMRNIREAGEYYGSVEPGKTPRPDYH